ncbi:vitellogenin-3-like [Diachasmimorpha longicaudata]|uniref:vitellogenin-3-like n=1 Tax=Diachasmimorpha longicaudata TaxID=58733 RepID=UPI0030B91C45
MMTVSRQQSIEMACGIKIATALVVYVAIANAGPSPFLRDRGLVYRYYGDVKAGLIEPAAYASQFGISGYFNVEPVDNNPEYPNSFVAALKNVKTGLHNGLAEHYQQTKAFGALPESAKILEDPFLIVYDDNGQLAGVKISTEEPGWSKNMKLAMISMFQLDLPSMNLESPIKHQSFMSKENTIHGDCWISYDVHAKDPNAVEESNELVITKFGSPRNCTNYNVFTFNNAEIESCDLPPEKPVNMASRKVLHAERRGQDILIKSLVAHGGVNYFPWKGRSEAHYVLNNASFVLLEDTSSELDAAAMDFSKLPLITDISYQKPHSSFAVDSGLDITQGRHVVDQNLSSKVMALLGDAADYLDQDHLEAKEPNFNYGQTINRIIRAMSFMNSSAIQILYDDIQSPQTPKEEIMKNIFLEALPYVGTPASITVTSALISSGSIDNFAAIKMLANFPLSVRNPTEESLTLILPLLNVTPYNVKSAAIPNVGSLIFRTFKNTPEPKKNAALNSYIDLLYNLIINEEYDKKVAGLAALRNIQVGRVFDILASLIREEVEISNLDYEDLKTNIRLHAIWAVEKSIPSYQAAHDLLWPIMANSNLPLKLRIAAYDILIRQVPTMTNILHIYWFMVYEKNEHLYNYHYTTLKGLANSVNPCDMHLKELATKIMRFTKIHTPVSYKLSSSNMVNAIDEIYGHGDQFSVSYTLDEKSGLPEVLSLESSVMEGRRRVSLWKVQLIVAKDTLSLSLLFPFAEYKPSYFISNEDVRRILQEGSRNNYFRKLSVDVVVSYKGRVVFGNSYKGNRMTEIISDLEPVITFEGATLKVRQQLISYDNMYEQHVISEMGLPILMENKIPSVSSVIGSVEKDMLSPIRFTKDIDYKVWRHGHYSMSIYNPLLDVWHSIRKTTATDFQMSFQSTSGFNIETQTWESSIPILPMTKHSRQGMVTHAKDSTTVSEDDGGALKESCPSCEHHETVTKGIAAKRNHEVVQDIKDIGLRFSNSIFDCETGLTPISIDKDFFRSLYQERKNALDNDAIAELLALSQTVRNLINSPRMGSCGVMYKMEPSTKYPTSSVKISIKMNAETRDEDKGILHILSGSKLSIRANVKAFSAITSEITRDWHMNMDFNMNREHGFSTMSLQLSRFTPGEKNLLICIDTQKSYPSIPSNPLKVGVTKEVTHGKLVFSMAETDSIECPRDQILITINTKGELSEEQKKKFIQESISGDCKADMESPLYTNSQHLIPTTTNCLEHAIRFTTLRKYTINVTYSDVPQWISSSLHACEDEIKALFYPHMVYTSEHTNEGAMKIIVKFPMTLDNLNISVATPDQGWDVIGADVSETSWLGIERNPPRLEGFGPNPDKHVWMSPLDNTRFPLKFLRKYKDNAIKLCSLHPKSVLTTDGSTIPYEVPEEWTLVTGDSIKQGFAVFVKNVNNVMGVKFFLGDDVVEFSPHMNGNSFKINGDEFSSSRMINGTYVPEDNPYMWSFKLTNYGDVNTIEMKFTPIVVFYSVNSVALLIDQELQGSIMGLCGCMDGTHKTTLSKVYRLP